MRPDELQLTDGASDIMMIVGKKRKYVEVTSVSGEEYDRPEVVTLLDPDECREAAAWLNNAAEYIEGN